METGFSDIHQDIIQTHLLPRLDGGELAIVSCVSATLRTLSTSHDLWSRICHCTWPSTDTPRLRQVISSFPSGPLSFFSLAYPLLHPSSSSNLHRPSSQSPPETLISAVDFFYKNEPVLSKTQETETSTGWFRSAPFRIDLLDTKEAVPTPIPSPGLDDTCQYLYRDLELSWIVIDPVGRRAGNVSSMKPVSVHRHWLTGEVQAKFATVMVDAGGNEVLCVVEVTWAAVEGAEEEEGQLKVREVGLEVEDVDGIRLSGKESVEILQRALEWGRRVAARGRRRGGDALAQEEDGGGRRRTYEEFMERRRERGEKRKREEGIWDMVYVAMAVLICVALFVRFVWPR